MILNTKTKAIISGFIFSVLFSFLNFGSKCESISNKILRLHIIANSDSLEDQNLKLKVRDRVLLELGSKFSNAKDLLDAEKITEENMNLIESLVQDEILKNGYTYLARVSLVKMHFDTRKYENITMPAGDYNALRVTIGEAKGKNWWCVMFPPMCLPAAQGNATIEDVLSPCEHEIICGKNKYSIAFKTVEIFFKVKEFLKESVFDPVNDFMSSETFKYRIGFKILEI